MQQEWSFGKYLVINQIAEGAQGKVYRAIDPSTGIQVALKVLHSHQVQDEKYVDRFLREARTAASLKHPNVVEIFEVGEFDGSHFIAMEFIPGTLAEYMRTDQQMKGDVVARFTAQIADALTAAGEKGIVHRDIKPSNVLISSSGEVKIADFGIAIRGDQTIDAIHAAALGTWNYMAPEAARGEELDARSDIYSLGVVMFEMLTGHRPFEADTPAAMIQQLLYTEPAPISVVRPDLSLEFADIVERCLSKDPAFRFQSAEVLAQHLWSFVPEATEFPEESRVDIRSSGSGLADAIQYKPAVVAFAIAVVGPLVVLLFAKRGGLNNAELIAAVTGFGFLAVGALLTWDQMRTGSSQRYRRDLPPVPRSNLTRHQLMLESIRQYMGQIHYLEGLTALERLRNQHLHVQSAAARLGERTPHDFQPLASLAAEAYRRGLRALATAVSIQEILQSSDIEKLEADIEETGQRVTARKNDGSLSYESPDMDRMLSDRLGRLEERLVVVRSQEDRLALLLDEAGQVEHFLFKTWADLTSLDSGKSQASIHDITNSLVDSLDTIKEVDQELERQGLLNDVDPERPERKE